MRRIIPVLLLLSAFAAGASAQTSNVTATITDADSQTWNNGTYTISFVQPPNDATAPVWNGTLMTPSQKIYTGSLSGSGVLTVALPDNTFITPGGSLWLFVICPNATAQCGQVSLKVTGASPNLSTTLSSAMPVPRFSALLNAYGYLDVEVTPTPVPGGTYFNVTNHVTRVWSGSAWANQGSGSGGVTGVTGTSPIVSSGGASPAISCPTCTANPAPVFNVLNSGAVCDGAHLAADTAGIKAALNSASAVGGIAYVPHGTCQFDNSAGAFVLSAFSGGFTGDGKASSIACNTLANDCFDFNSATNLTISNLAFSFSPTTTTRGGGYPLNIDSGSNVLLLNNYFTNGDLSGVRIGNSSNVRAVGNTISNFLANGFFTLNNIDLKFENTTCSNNQDACEEYSYYDTGTQASCTRITSTGMTSNNDLAGFLINSCSQVAVSDFAITGAGHEGIDILQDSSTTTLVFPDQVQISNGTITNAGYGSNTLNRNTAQGIVINIAGTPATFQNVNISNVAMKHVAGRGIELGDSNTVNLTGTGIRIDDAGNGNTSTTAEGVYLDGNVVKFTGLYVSNAGTYSFRNHLGVYVSLTDYTSVNPNQLGAATNGTLNEANGNYFSLDGASIIDTFAGANRSGISSTASTGVQTITNVTTLCTVTCNSGISVTNSSGINSAGFQNLAVTTATNGWIGQNGNRLLHTFGGVTELFVGTNAGSFSVTGVNNVGIGDGTLAANTSGNKNTAVGAFAMNAVVSGTQNTAVGNSAYNVGTGSSSVVVGSGALSAQTAGNNSTAVGAFALSTSTGTGPNTCIGENCLAGITTGSQNFGAGVNAGNGFTTATKTISIGDSVNSAGTNNLNQSSCIGFSCQNALSNEVRFGSSSEFQDFPGTAGVELTATASLTAGQVVKIDSANASSVVVAATTDITGGIAIGLVNNAPGAAGVAMVATSGIRNAVLGTGTCSIGNFVIVDTTTAGRVKCTGTYAAGTVIGVAVTAQASVGSNVSVMIGLR